MGMCLALHSVSDENIGKILKQPELIWRLIAADDPDIYEESIKENNKIGFFSKLFGEKRSEEVEVPNLIFSEGENVDDDLDKSWHGIHYCLNKTAYDAEPPMNFITDGWEVAGDIEVGYGPARLFNSDAVEEIYKNLSNITTDNLRENYNPKEMDKLDIYPVMWEQDENEGLEYITNYFENLKSFVENCVKNNMGMAIYLC